jgi:nucleoid DNA-binding protein
MSRHHWWRWALIATLGAILVASPAQSQRPPGQATVARAVSNKTKIAEKDVAKVLEALAPVIREKLSNGETVEVPGLGTFRVVGIPAHKDLVKGRPATIEATNSVEFVPFVELVRAANSADAVPAVTVPEFEFDPLPNQTKGLRTPNIRAPNVRTP